MPTEPTVNITSTAPVTTSAIENEIPAYRAISPAAVVALILGLISVFSFVSLYFLVVAAAAVLVGLAADRKIQKVPDVLTGRSLAQAGVGLGLIFGLTSLSVSGVQNVLRASEAKRVARSYETVLTKGTFSEAVWYAQHPDLRDRVSPDKLVDEQSKGRNAATLKNRNAAPPGSRGRLAEKHGRSSLRPCREARC